jgi:hypothetical protein
VNGALVIAVIVGAALQSLTAFCVTLVLGICVAVSTGGIRLDRTRRRD